MARRSNTIPSPTTTSAFIRITPRDLCWSPTTGFFRERSIMAAESNSAAPRTAESCSTILSRTRPLVNGTEYTSTGILPERASPITSFWTSNRPERIIILLESILTKWALKREFCRTTMISISRGRATSSLVFGTRRTGSPWPTGKARRAWTPTPFPRTLCTAPHNPLPRWIST